MTRASAAPTILAIACLGAMPGCREPNSIQLSQASSTGTPGAQASADPIRQSNLAASYESTALCNVEFLGDRAFSGAALNLSAPALLSGWLADELGRPLASASLVIEDQSKAVVREYSVELTLNRPDVVMALKGKVTTEKTGFSVRLAPAGLTSGEYHLYLIYRVEMHSYACDSGRHLVIPG